MVAEFDRTVRANGSNGSDHGTDAAAFLLGSSVKGRCVIGDWPGLGQLYENRDLMPANDLRGLLKAVLHNQMGLSEAQLAECSVSRQQPERHF